MDWQINLSSFTMVHAIPQLRIGESRYYLFLFLLENVVGTQKYLAKAPLIGTKTKHI